MHASVGLLLPVLLLTLPCAPGLPFYNGFYYSPGGRDLGSDHRESACPQAMP